MVYARFQSYFALGQDMRKTVCILSAAALLVGCSSKSEDVKAAHVSTLGYKRFTCVELIKERELLKSKIVQIASDQDAKAGSDAAAMAVGGLLFWPALLFLAAGDDKEGELGRLKGEFDAVTEVAKMKQCLSDEQLQAAEQQRIAAQEALKAKQSAGAKGLRSGT